MDVVFLIDGSKSMKKYFAVAESLSKFTSGYIGNPVRFGVVMEIISKILLILEIDFRLGDLKPVISSNFENIENTACFQMTLLKINRRQ